MRHLPLLAVALLTLAGCSSPAPVEAAPAGPSVSLSALQNKVCVKDDPEQWAYCVQTAVAYLDASLDVYRGMVSVGTSTPELAATASNLATLRERCVSASPTELNTRECRYTFKTIMSTGQDFQNQVRAVAG